jgi:outer membrane receptor protein involved in Fe transport
VRLTAGGELQAHLVAKQFADDEINGPTLSTSDTFRVAAGYVVGDVVPSKRIKVSAAARLDAYSYDPSDPSVSGATAHSAISFSSLNPRLAVIYKPYDGGNLKVTGGKGFRAPSVYELFFITSTGQHRNDDLQPEDVYSAEIEYSHRLNPTLVGLLAVYTNYIKGLIAQRQTAASTPDNPQYQYVNTDVPVASIGAEAELRREWKEGWMYAFSYSLQRSQYLKSDHLSDFFALASNPSLREVPNSPTHLLSARGAVPIVNRALTAMSRVSYVSGRYDRNDTVTAPPQTKTDPAVIWDLVVSGVESRWGLRYALGLYNVFDWREYDPVSPEFRQTTILQAGRTLLASVNAAF